MSATNYFNKMTGYIDHMVIVGHPLSHDEIIGYILAGLGPKYAPLMDSLTIFNMNINLNDSYTYLPMFVTWQE